MVNIHVYIYTYVIEYVDILVPMYYVLYIYIYRFTAYGSKHFPFGVNVLNDTPNTSWQGTAGFTGICIYIYSIHPEKR